MISFEGAGIIKGVVALRNLENVSRNMKETDKVKPTDPLSRASARTVVSHLDRFSGTVAGLNVRATALAVAELRATLTAHKLKITHKQFGAWVEDVRVTFRREISLIKMFCVESKYESYFDVDLSIFGSSFKTAFASAVYEIDEAGKCHALGRSTASVFHLMRATEIAVQAVAKCLGIPDPTKDWERNWGIILGKIKIEMDRRSAARPPQWNGSDKEFFAGAYASLDSVRVAWRNTTELDPVV
jgi:hypothetical protein